jgi:hypothetical protein
MEPEGSLPYSQQPAIFKLSVHVRGFCENISQHNNFLPRGIVRTSSKPQPGGPPLFGCPRVFIQYIRSYPPYWRPFLHPHREDAPCRDDRVPLIMDGRSDAAYQIMLQTF